MDITVWMSSPNDEVLAVASGSDTGGSRRTASRTVPERPSVAAWALVYPRVGGGARRQPGGCWPYAAGDNSRRRVSLLTHRVRGTLWSNVGPNISRSAGPHDSWRPRGVTGSGGTAWTSFLVRGLYSDTREPHTMFRLLNIFLASSVLGRTARTSHNSEPSLRQSLCTECTGKPWPQRSAWISSTGKSVGMTRITAFSLRSSSRRRFKYIMEKVYETLNNVQTQLLVWDKPFASTGKDVIICITGNPGVVDFYEEFGTALNDITKLPVCVIEDLEEIKASVVTQYGLEKLLLT
ncbi:Lipid droplet-associated hydrolase [Eumeta japonica]|uniref:Lipid droplet-associated hydrolase n=1 Tax=Eumeta variegata TaxID=151549 RepID=A0A4C1ZE05_EUMVA|nr:Lipid droplet-associated hydrolase [Eumeta japonica]